MKRFSNNGRKDQKFIDFPLTNLDLTEYIVGYDKSSYKYDLYGICNHSGVVAGGHYTAFIKYANSSWYLYNDSNVTKISNSNVVVNKNAYILFYKKMKSFE